MTGKDLQKGPSGRVRKGESSTVGRSCPPVNTERLSPFLQVPAGSGRLEGCEGRKVLEKHPRTFNTNFSFHFPQPDSASCPALKPRGSASLICKGGLGCTPFSFHPTLPSDKQGFLVENLCSSPEEQHGM